MLPLLPLLAIATGPLAVAAPSIAPEGFRAHLEHAIVLNGRRCEIYARRSEGRSRALSELLIRTEYAILPFAGYLDDLARPWNQRGCGVILRDFAGMQGVAEVSAAPRYRSVASLAGMRQLTLQLGAYRGEVVAANREGDFARIAHASARMLDEVAAHEAAEQAHFAMARHVVESLGLAALHGLSYGSATCELTQNLIGIQALGLGSVVAIDGWAQQLQHEGIGIVVNDVPKIPFLEEYEAWRRTLSGSPAEPDVAGR